jgi:hypothetical protein
VRFHPKALFATVAAGAILWLAVNVWVGVAAILALTLIDVFSFLTPMGFFHGGYQSSKTDHGD